MAKMQLVSSLGGAYKIQKKSPDRAFAAAPQSGTLQSLAAYPDYDGLEFFAGLTQSAHRVVLRLQAIYGDSLYKKMIQLANQSASDGILQLEQDLLSGRVEKMLGAETETDSKSQLQNIKLSEEFGETVKHLNDDLDYLDALASQDAWRLNKFSPGRENLSAIFCEIVENEHQNNSNFQEDVFERNIQLIFNSEVDLDGLGPDEDEALARREVQSEGALSKQLNFFSFYNGTSNKNRSKWTSKPGIYYLTLWMGVSVAALAFAWSIIR